MPPPGVYVEEIGLPPRGIEGVTTSTAGFAGMTSYGPERGARLVQSLAEYERIYGPAAPIQPGGTSRPCHVGDAVRAFFENGGTRVWIARVFVARGASTGLGSLAVPVSPGRAFWRARYPGAYGNAAVEVSVIRSKPAQLEDGAVVEISVGSAPPAGNTPLTLDRLAVVRATGTNSAPVLFGQGGPVASPPSAGIQLVELTVKVSAGAGRIDAYSGLGADPAQSRYIAKVLERDKPDDDNAVVWFDWEPGEVPPADPFLPARLMAALQRASGMRLTGGDDGDLAKAADVAGTSTGLAALAEIDEIAVVALPDGGTYDAVEDCAAAANALIAHAEALRYRFAVVDPPGNLAPDKVRAFRARFHSSQAALYYPWVESAVARGLMLPPSGFIAGIYARADREHGVHKAPANEVVRGIAGFQSKIDKSGQDVLNPEGINALRYFEGKGNLVWGARTMSADPEWKYVNVRRLLIYLEHSIDRGTQWAVFEPNGPQLWAAVRQSVENFLLQAWRNGALLGSKPEEAFFVHCDRTTMAQNDLDNGRLVILIGVAPVKPAEFVIFRIGQLTAGAKP